MVGPTLHLHTASALPHWQDALVAGAVNRTLPRVGRHLSAMARTPGWVRGLTHGLAAHVHAEGRSEIELMEAALVQRGAPLFYQGSDALDRYRDALDLRWARLADAGDLAPGRLGWAAHDGPDKGPVPDGSWLVCTCQPGQGCHLTWLAPWLRSAGWSVMLYGAPAP